MPRYLAGVGSALLLILAGFFTWQSLAQRQDSPIPPAPQAQAEGDDAAPGPVALTRPRTPPAADARTKEERRFGRADRDRDGRVTLAELYQPRRRAFARLDTNNDGRLSFEEWAVRTTTKFSEADRNRDGALSAAEFATTAPRQRARRPACSC